MTGIIICGLEITSGKSKSNTDSTSLIVSLSVLPI